SLRSRHPDIDASLIWVGLLDTALSPLIFFPPPEGEGTMRASNRPRLRVSRRHPTDDAHNACVVIHLWGLPRKDDLAAFNDVEPIGVFGDMMDVRLCEEDRAPASGDGMNAGADGGDDGGREPLEGLVEEQHVR